MKLATTSGVQSTSNGARSEFARLAREQPRVSREQVSLLGWSYDLKNVADYEWESAVSLTEAERAIEQASQLVETIATLIESACGRQQRLEGAAASVPAPDGSECYCTLDTADGGRGSRNDRGSGTLSRSPPAQEEHMPQDQSTATRPALLAEPPQRLHHHAFAVKDQEANRHFIENILGIPHLAA